MAYAEMSTNELEWQYWIITHVMGGIRLFLKSPCCEQCKERETARLNRYKTKHDLITIELLSRVDFTELQDLYLDLKIDHINTVGSRT